MVLSSGPKIYKSPVRKLVRFFEKSRGQWKAKSRAAKTKIKRLVKRVQDMGASRARWKQRVKELEAELAKANTKCRDLEQEVSALKQAQSEAQTALVLGDFQRSPKRQQYSLGQIWFFLSFVLFARVSLRGASQAMLYSLTLLPFPLGYPDWTTGRLWLLRLGYYKLTRAKPQADDWVWIVDHTVQVGVEKCLLILGVRLSDLPRMGACLTHEAVEPIALLPVQHSNGDVVYHQLEATIEKTGVPRAIVGDHGPDLQAGVERFGEAHPETSLIYDIKHKTAAVLKRELEQDALWLTFMQGAAQAKSRLQQTDLAAFAPPNQRSKARYLNLAELVNWGCHILAWFDANQPDIPEMLSVKLGWILDFRSSLANWQALFAVVTAAESLVRQEGLYQGVQSKLKTQLEGLAHTQQSQRVAAELLNFVSEEESKVRPGERLPGSSEVIESVFGKFKYLEQDQAQSGFTGLVLSVCALVSTTTKEVVQQALEAVPVKKVLTWCKENLGASVQAKRRAIFTTPG